MGEKQVFQPLTREDKITVVLYRVGIVLTAIIMSVLAYLSVGGARRQFQQAVIRLADFLPTVSTRPSG